MMVALFQALMIIGGWIYPEHRILTAYIERVEARSQQSVLTPDGLASATVNAEVQELILIRNSATLYSTVFILVTCLIFGFYCSHRLGGPIYKTIRYLREYRESKSVTKLSFRNGDFFHELADEINETLKTKGPSISN